MSLKLFCGSYSDVDGQGSPHWDNNFCEADEQETKNKAEIAKAVPIPEYDPLFGYHGPLVGLWKAATVKRGE